MSALIPQLAAFWRSLGVRIEVDTAVTADLALLETVPVPTILFFTLFGGFPCPRLLGRLFRPPLRSFRLPNSARGTGSGGRGRGSPLRRP